MRVQKSLTERDLDFYSKVPNGFKPGGISETGYDFVFEDPSDNIIAVRAIAKKILWRSIGRTVNGAQYAAYCGSLKHRPPDEVLYEIQQRYFEVVYNPHGDLTMENVLGNTVFIDPGHCRGLPVAEIDESKLLQSIDGWEFMKHDRPVFGPVPHWVRRIHWVLLITHYCRLLCHPEKHNDICLSFAERRIIQIKDMLYGAP